MYAKLVQIDGVSMWVMCCPNTPLPEVLRRAAKMLEQDES